MNDNIQDIVKQIIYASPYIANPSDIELTLLKGMPAEKVIPYLKILFSQEKNATIRSKTFGALLALPKHDRVQYLLDIFEESSLDWQIAICEELGRLSPDSRSIVKLCSIASSAPDPDLRFAAVESLGNIGDHMAIPTLEHVSHHDKGKDYEGFSIAKEAHIAQEKIQTRLRKNLPHT